VKRLKRFGCAIPYVLFALSGTGLLRADLITNGGFETGTFSPWTVVNQAGSDPSANWFVQTGTLSPASFSAVPAPPQGTFAAMADQGGAATDALLQSFTVAPGSQVTLSFDVFVDNQNFDTNSNPVFFDPNTLDFNQVPNQQARIDILTSGAGALDLGGSVVDNLFTAAANTAGYVPMSFDITSAVGAGGTFQLRFVTAINLAPLVLGVDAVSITATTSGVPEPASWVLLAALVLSLAAASKWRKPAPVI
jgi:hypothetical protein